jgi:enamine deaminase RidA (YjgF/YER057c/UK114 family)
MGYCRAVRVGDHIFVAGTAPIMEGGADPPQDAYGQMRRCLDIVAKALADAGSGLEHVVRTRIYLARREDFEEVARAHGEVFSVIRPVNTTVVVGELIDPRWALEIEVDAVAA